MQGASTEEATQKAVEVYLTRNMSDGRFVNNDVQRISWHT